MSPAVEDFAWLVDSGVSPLEAARRVGWTPSEQAIYHRLREYRPLWDRVRPAVTGVPRDVNPPPVTSIEALKVRGATASAPIRSFNPKVAA